MPAAVPRQKRNALSLKRTKHYGIRRLAERRSHANLARIRQSIHRIESAPANDSNRRLGSGFRALRLTGLLCRHLFSLL
jgi:hypothetical protein